MTPATRKFILKNNFIKNAYLRRMEICIQDQFFKLISEKKLFITCE